MCSVATGGQRLPYWWAGRGRGGPGDAGGGVSTEDLLVLPGVGEREGVQISFPGRIPQKSLEDRVGVGGMACKGLSQRNSRTLEMPYV